MEVVYMLVKISDIKIGPSRREVEPNDALALSKSISEIGLLNPITITADYTLIAGMHRLEAVKLLGWTEIECTISDLNGLRAELAEIDENVVRTNLTPIEFGDLLLRRKEIYEILHPESRATKDGGAFRGNQHEKEVTALSAATSKSFVEDTSQKLGISPRTVREKIQTAKNLTPKTKGIIQGTGGAISSKNALKLSRLGPEEQEEAATQLVTGEIKSIDEYQKPYSEDDTVFATLEESIADLKNPNKDSRYTPDLLLSDIDNFIERFQQDMEWYDMPMFDEVIPQISQIQFDYVKERFATIPARIEVLLQRIERSLQHEEK